MTENEGVAAVTARAVNLYAIGRHHQAIVILQGVMAERSDGFAAAAGLAARVVADPTPPLAWEITGLTTQRHRRAVPVAGQLVDFTRAHNYGALHQVWDQLPGPVAGDVIAVLLAMAGAGASHPELN